MTSPQNSTLSGQIFQGSNTDLTMLPKDKPEEVAGSSGKPEKDKPEEGESGENEGAPEEGGPESDGDPEPEEEGEGDDSRESDENEDPEGGGSESDGDPEPEEEGEIGPGDGGSEEEGDPESKEGEGSSEEGKASGDGEGEPEEGGDQGFGQDLIRALAHGTGLIDNNSALSAAITKEAKSDIKHGEAAWRPRNPDLDVVAPAADGNAKDAEALKDSVRKETSFLTTRFRSKFLSSRTPTAIHGVRKGLELSDQRLVDSMVEIWSGCAPSRPDWMRTTREDCSITVAVVLDESGSMNKLREQVARAALAVSIPLDALGAPCLVIGPRNGDRDSSQGSVMDGGTQVFHRVCGVIVDIFKDWHEPLRKCLRRFANVKACGTTPLEDGIQYAMQEMSKRTERHRVILVLTDGEPDNRDVCRRQIRQAAEVGIHVIGVALNSGCAKDVKGLFPENICVEDVSALPKELLEALSSIVFPKVGRKMKFETTMTAKRKK